MNVYDIANDLAQQIKKSEEYVNNSDGSAENVSR